MALNPILIAAVGGAIGGALGAVIGAGAARLFRQSRRPKGLAPLAAVVAAVGALGGARIGSAMAAPSIADQLVGAAPVFRTLKDRYPDTFNAMVAQLSTAPPGADKVQLVNLARPSLLGLIQRQMPKFSPQNTDALFRIEIQEAEAVEKVSPENCLNLMNSRPLTIAAADVVPAVLLRQDLNLQNRALIQAVQAPSPPPVPLSQSEVAALAKAALPAISPADQQTALNVVRAGGVASNARDADLGCRFYIAMMGEALKTPGTIARLAALK